MKNKKLEAVQAQSVGQSVIKPAQKSGEQSSVNVVRRKSEKESVDDLGRRSYRPREQDCKEVKGNVRKPWLKSETKAFYCQSRDKDKCFKCGSFGFYANSRNCQAINQKCTNCGTRGHFAVMCRYKKRVSVIQDDEESEEERTVVVREPPGN
ncbi:CCHC-type zinc finger nucleic acid binding protein-like [Ambystoma mexicanum]|uniref:CCHC-type zinc finger nucleic acid binding protein-like n=1 Tax=Ambystoma mexicanum TaxID=8296 RepID=UPI0037E841BA